MKHGWLALLLVAALGSPPYARGSVTPLPGRAGQQAVFYQVAVLHYQPIERVALAIGNRAITESQIDEELRVTALLNHHSVIRDRQTRRAAASRMIEQLLIQREAEVSRFPAPGEQAVDNYEKQVERDYGGQAALNLALQQDELTPAELRDHLARQIVTLRFIDFRFRPDANTSSNSNLEQRADEALAIWLTEERKRSKVVFLDKSLE